MFPGGSENQLNFDQGLIAVVQELIINKKSLVFTEQKLERAVLLDRCHHLQVDNQDLNRTAETLSKRMAVCDQIIQSVFHIT